MTVQPETGCYRKPDRARTYHHDICTLGDHFISFLAFINAR